MCLQRIICFLKGNPWSFVNVACFTAFIIQMCIIANDHLYPSETVSHRVEKKLDEIQFPVLFKICIKPAFNLKELQNAGYYSIWDYFTGQSRYDKSVYGWAGHTTDGKVYGSVQGLYHCFIIT